MATKKLSNKRKAFIDLAKERGIGPKIKRKELLEFCAAESIPIAWWLTNDLSCRAGEHGFYIIPFYDVQSDEVAMAQDSEAKYADALEVVGA